MNNQVRVKKFIKELESEIFTFTKKDDAGRLSFHTGQFTIASILKLYYHVKKVFPVVKGKKTKNASVGTRF